MLAAAASIVFQSESIFLTQITQPREAPVYVLPVATHKTYKETGDVEDYHWYPR